MLVRQTCNVSNYTFLWLEQCLSALMKQKVNKNFQIRIHLKMWNTWSNWAWTPMLLINLICCLLNRWNVSRLRNYRKTDTLRSRTYARLWDVKEERKRGRETGDGKQGRNWDESQCNQRCGQMLFCVIPSERSTKSSNGKFSCYIRSDSNLDLGAKFLLPLIGAVLDTLPDVCPKSVITHQMSFMPFCWIKAQRPDD